MNTIRDPKQFKTFSLMQVGEPGVVAKGWFNTADALTPQAAETQIGSMIAESVDLIVSCHHLTKIVDPKPILAEFTRVLSRRGLVFLSFPSPFTRSATTESGSGQNSGGDFRIFGKDFEEVLPSIVNRIHVSAVQVCDPVTKDEDLVYLLSKDFAWQRRILQTGFQIRLLH